MSNVTDKNASMNDDYLGNDFSRLLELLGKLALSSHWLCRAVECYGQNADELHALSDQRIRTSGKELLRIFVDLDSIADGYFSAYRGKETKPWLVVRATDSGLYRIESTDPLVDKVKMELRSETKPARACTSSGVAELTDRVTVTLADSLPSIVSSLRRIQTEGNIIENFVVFIANERKNYFIQIVPESNPSPYTRNADEQSLYAESVGNSEIRAQYALLPDQVEQLQALGWKVSPITPNFYRTWRASNDDERKLIALALINTFRKGYGIRPDQKMEIQTTISRR